MNTQITFNKTGNFWIDNGIVGLYRIFYPTGVLQEIQNENQQVINYEVVLEADKLTIQLLDARKADETKENKRLPLSLFLGISEAEEAKENKNSKLEKIEKIHPDLLLVLNWAKDDVVNKYYLTQTDGAGWFFKNNQFEAYQKTDFKMHLKSFFKGKTPITEGALCVPANKNEIKKYLDTKTIAYKVTGSSDSQTIELTQVNFTNGKPLTVPNTKASDTGSKGRFMNESEFLDFIDFLSKNSPKKFGKKDVKLTGKGFLSSKPKYSIGQDFESSFIVKGKKQCDFSQELYDKVENISGMNYPFITGSSGEKNFASFLNKNNNISSKYSYISLFSFFHLYFLMQGDLQNYFILYESDLKKLKNFYNKIVVNPTQLKNATYCNFQNDIIGTQYEFETLFAFILSIYNQLSGKMGKDERQGIYSKSIFTFTNDGNIFRDVKEYSSLAAFFKLLDAFGNEGQLNTLINLVKFFQKRVKATEYDTTWRNRICRDLLNFQSIAQTLEAFLSEVNMKEKEGQGIPNLNQIIEIYYNTLTNLDMDNNMVDMCKRVGNSIGRYCRETDDKGILFSIRNARNRIDFLKILSDSQFRTEVLYSEEFFDKLPDTPQWEEYKSLVSIFAMNSYLMKKKKENQPSNN